MVIAALQDQWCHPEGCTPEDEETIQAIIKNIKESGRRFWYCVFMYSVLFVVYLSMNLLSYLHEFVIISP